MTCQPAIEASQMAALRREKSSAASYSEALAGSTACAIWFQWPEMEEVAAVGGGGRRGGCGGLEAGGEGGAPGFHW